MNRMIKMHLKRALLACAALGSAPAAEAIELKTLFRSTLVQSSEALSSLKVPKKYEYLKFFIAAANFPTQCFLHHKQGNLELPAWSPILNVSKIAS